MRLTFADVVIDTDRFAVERDGEQVQIQPQVFDVLVHLATHRDRVVPKTELLDEVWGDRFVGEAALTTRIRDARRAVGDDGTAQSIIRTVHGRGYQFIADVETDAGATPASGQVPEQEEVQQHIHFCTAADGVRLAYATIGNGPPLVRAAHWITHLDYDWHSPVWRHWLLGLARGRTLVRYDERGCGLSDHDPPDVTFEAFIEDLEAVVDDLGLDRFPLLGVSQGGPVAVEYARRHPQRVTKLILVGAYVKGKTARAVSDEERREAEVELELIRLGWGRDDPSFRRFFTSRFIPDGPPELWDAFAELMRRTTSAENAARILEATSEVDVTRVATELDVPTVIFHGRDELRIPFDEGRRFATLIRGSRFIPLDTANHLMQPDEPAWEHFLREVDLFLAEE